MGDGNEEWENKRISEVNLKVGRGQDYTGRKGKGVVGLEEWVANPTRLNIPEKRDTDLDQDPSNGEEGR